MSYSAASWRFWTNDDGLYLGPGVGFGMMLAPSLGPGRTYLESAREHDLNPAVYDAADTILRLGHEC